MDNQSSADSRSWPIASPIGWGLAPALEAFFIVPFLKADYLDWKNSNSESSAISGLLIVALIVWYCHSFATGSVDAEGIMYKRYFRQRKVFWRDVREVQWRGSQIRIVLAQKSSLHRNLDFILNPFGSLAPYWVHRLGGNPTLPPILERIHALAGELPNFVSAPSGPRWFFRIVLILSLLLFVALALRLLFAWTS